VQRGKAGAIRVPSSVNGIDPNDFTISVIIPVFNEEATLQQILEQVRAVDISKEIICVDDGSTDRSREILEDQSRYLDTRVFFHRANRGKGGAVRTGLLNATGDIVLIQDADLEYDPRDYEILLRPILEGRAKVVYGSRFLGAHKAMYFWHAVGNRFLTLVTNVLYDTTLTDMETCYKVFTRDVAKTLTIRQERWGIDPEITAKILRQNIRIYEVPVSYNGREFWEGKKISWRDGFVILRTLFRYRFFN
jgi:glycosyltransferase involved in cell wall biosynthesis